MMVMQHVAHHLHTGHPSLQVGDCSPGSSVAANPCSHVAFHTTSYSWCLGLQVGNYSLGSRASVVAWRGLQFLAVGAASSAVGHSLTRTLVWP